MPGCIARREPRGIARTWKSMRLRPGFATEFPVSRFGKGGTKCRVFFLLPPGEGGTQCRMGALLAMLPCKSFQIGLRPLRATFYCLAKRKLPKRRPPGVRASLARRAMFPARLARHGPARTRPFLASNMRALLPCRTALLGAHHGSLRGPGIRCAFVLVSRPDFPSPVSGECGTKCRLAVVPAQAGTQRLSFRRSADADMRDSVFVEAEAFRSAFGRSEGSCVGLVRVN